MIFNASLPYGVDAAMRRVISAFADAGLDTPALDARILTLAAAQIPHVSMISEPEHQLSQPQILTLEGYAARRLAHEPVSRILGVREFRGRDFLLTPHVLDPRPDSETLIDVAAGCLRADARCSILDLGTGSGCLLITMLTLMPNACGAGVDISPDALICARANAVRHGLDLRTRFVCGDWYSAITGRFDLVIANPPYIKRGDLASLAPDVARYDPALALDGGGDGLAAYRKILNGITCVMNENAWLVMEIGAGQETALIPMMRGAGLAKISRHEDLTGHIRVLKAKFEKN